MPVIEVNHLTKEYRLGQLQSLTQTVRHALDRLRDKPISLQEPFRALDDVHFQVEAGEVLGIIGHNGAGKSTLLKMLARISTPTRGNVKVKGAVAPLIEVGAGLVPDLTGRENIYLNGAILGMRRAEIVSKFDDIVAFAELEEFIDTPIKRYSSGMQVRLGFSIATSVEAEVLIVDEVLAVGDLAFQRKCFDRMEDMIKRQRKTVLLVSHNIRQVERLCTRVILLDHGRILTDGKPRETCNLFYQRNDQKINDQMRNRAHKNAAVHNNGSGEIELLSLSLLDESGQASNRTSHDAPLTVVLVFKFKVRLVNPIIGIGIHTTDLLCLIGGTSDQQLQLDTVEPGMYEVRCQIPALKLLPGMYSFRIGVGVGRIQVAAFYAENVMQFTVDPHPRESGLLRRDEFFRLEANWDMKELDKGSKQYRK